MGAITVGGPPALPSRLAVVKKKAPLYFPVFSFRANAVFSITNCTIATPLLIDRGDGVFNTTPIPTGTTTYTVTPIIQSGQTSALIRIKPVTSPEVTNQAFISRPSRSRPIFSPASAIVTIEEIPAELMMVQNGTGQLAVNRFAGLFRQLPITKAGTYVDPRMITDTVAGNSNMFSSMYYACTNLTSPMVHQDGLTMNGVTSGWNYAKYEECTSLQEPEDIPPSFEFQNATSGFQQREYIYCTSLQRGQYIPNVTFSKCTSEFQNAKYESCVILHGKDNMPDAVYGSITDGFMSNKYATCTNLTSVESYNANVDFRTATTDFCKHKYVGCSITNPEIYPTSRTDLFNSIYDTFCYGKYESCAMLQNVEEYTAFTSSFANVRYGFLRNTYIDCSSVRAMQPMFANEFKPIAIAILGNNWTSSNLMFAQTFAFSTATPAATNEVRPRFADNTYVTNIIPAGDNGCFYNRTGMPGYSSLNANWR